MSAFRYSYRPGASYPVKAQDAGEHIKELEKAHGKVTAQLVVDDSRPDDSMLHGCFEWDDQVAGENWRREEARRLIGNIVTVEVVQKESEPPREVTIRAFSNVNPSIYTEGVYKTTQVAITRPDEAEIILQNARREMQVYISKYRDLVDIRALYEALTSGKAS